MTFEEYVQKHLGTAGYNFSAMELIRMGWNARGKFGDEQAARESEGGEARMSDKTMRLLDQCIAEHPLPTCDRYAAMTGAKDEIARLRQKLERAYERILYLQDWQELAFKAHPSIDLDVEHQADEASND